MRLPAPLEVAAALDAHRNFLRQGPNTFCSLYLSAFMGLRGRRMHWGHANEQIEWLGSPEGKAEGWQHITAAEALACANAHEDVVCGVILQPHGHVAVCLESLPNTPGRLCVSAAGGENYVRAPIERSFGHYAPSFWVNLEPQ